MARRKNNQTRKYKPLNEFRYNRSPTAGNHPNYVFGETPTKYKSVGLTTHPRENIKHIPLRKNPNPKEDRQSFVQNKVLTSRKNYLEERLDGWNFAREDMAIIRLIKKDYKKRTRRSKKKSNKKR
ncbi:MAG: hypothetical protein RR033_03130 [Clostridia bacterium]